LTIAETTLSKALQKARQAHSPEVEAPCLQALGRLAYLAGRLGDSIGFLQGAAQQFEHSGLVVEGTTAQSDLALVQLRVYGRHVALETVGRALKTLDVAGDRLEAAKARLHQAIVLGRGMDLDAPTQSTTFALKVFEEFSYSYGIAKSTLMLAELALLRGDVEQADRQARSSLQQHEAIGDAHGTALCLLFLGRCALEQGLDEEAREQLAHALDIVVNNGLMLYSAPCTAYLGCVEEQRGNLDKAHRYYTDAYNQSLQSGDQEQVANAAVLLGSLAFIRGELSNARGLLETGLNVANEIDMTEYRVRAMFGLAWLETLNGQFNARQALMEQLLPMVRPLNAPDFFLRERVARVTRAVIAVHGSASAEHYRRTALDIIHNLR
ncbi:MAG: tetratricopeptide repeat protein, partial [Myxococcota bacterium]